MTMMSSANQNSQISQTELPAELSAEALFSALSSDMQCCVIIAEISGEIRYGNFAQSGACGGYEQCPMRDKKHLGDALPREQADQLLSCMRRASDNELPIVIVWYLAGVRSRTVVRPLNNGSGLVLLTTRSANGTNLDATHDNDTEVVHSLAGDAGPLASLTQRETEVLELIGRGYSTAKIAETLNRSTKTIEWHRASIGNKLNASNRVELARIAISSGLTVL